MKDQTILLRDGRKLGYNDPIHFWHGDKDVNVPISHAEYLSSKIPNAGLTRLEGLDHLTTTIHGLSPALAYLLEK